MFLNDHFTFDECAALLESMTPQESQAMEILLREVQSFAGGTYDSETYEDTTLDEFIDEAMRITWEHVPFNNPDGPDRVLELTEALLCKEVYCHVKGWFERNQGSSKVGFYEYRIEVYDKDIARLREAWAKSVHSPPPVAEA